MGMVFAARTGPPGSTVHFWEYSAGQDGCIRAGHPLLAPKTPSTGDLGRQTDFVETNKHVSRRTGPQNDVDLRNVSQLQRYRRNLPCRILRFLHGPGGGTSGPERTPQLFLCNLQLEVCKTPRESIADIPIERAGQQRPHPALKSSRVGTLLTDPIGKQTRLERHPKIGCPSRV